MIDYRLNLDGIDWRNTDKTEVKIAFKDFLQMQNGNTKWILNATKDHMLMNLFIFYVETHQAWAENSNYTHTQTWGGNPGGARPQS